MSNASGMTVTVASLGGIITSLVAPDREGRLDDVVLGYDTLEEYRRDTAYLGAIVGRYANRIALGRFTLDGTTYQLAANDGPNHLHGGRRGFARVEWAVTSRPGALELAYTSPDGEEGYPGTLQVRVSYELNDRNELAVEYRATTDERTPVNLTQHSYFNLAGRHSGTVRGQRLTIAADGYIAVDDALIPTGPPRKVAGTRFDFRSGRAVEPGYDTTFVLRAAGADPAHAARLEEPVSGRTLDVYTTEPGVHLYTGFPGGLCLETQHFPDSPNRPDFPSTILRPGSVFRSRTVFAFGCLARTHDGRGS